MRDFLHSNYVRLKKELGEEFSPEDVGIVEGALRVTTKEAMELQRQLFGDAAVKTGGGGYKSRGAFFYTDENGNFRRYMTLKEANEEQRRYLTGYLDDEVAAGRIAKDSPEYRNFYTTINGNEELGLKPLDWFDTDVMNVFARNVNKIERNVHKAVAVDLFRRAGLLVEADIDKAARPGAIAKMARKEIERLEEEAAILSQRFVDTTKIRPAAPSGETARLANDLSAQAQAANEMFFAPVRPVAELSAQADVVAKSAATDEGNLNRAISRTEEQLDAYRAQIQENLTQANTLRQAIIEVGMTDEGQQGAAFGALLDTIITMKKDQADKLAARVGVTKEVQELRKAAGALMEAKNRQATAVINLTARAEPMVRLGTTLDKRGNLVKVENQFNNLWAPGLLAEALSNSYKLTNETRTVVENALRTSTNVWKQWATFGRGPAFVFRNIGGWWNAFLVGANGKDFTDGIKYATQYELALKDFREAVGNIKGEDINEAATLLEESFRKRMSGKNFAGGDMYEAHLGMEQQGIFGGTLTSAAMEVDPRTNIAKSVTAAEVYGRGAQKELLRAPGETDLGIFRGVREGTLTVGEAAKELAKVPKGELAKKGAKSVVRGTINNPYMYVMKAFSDDSERFLRASTFATGMRQYGSDQVGQEMASMLVKASQFDYTDLSPAEQRVMKLISPFFVWTKNNVPYQFRNLFANPGKVNAILKLQENVKERFGDEEDDRLEYMPQWLQEQLGFASTFQSGENALAMSLNIPLTDLNRFFEVPVTESGKLDITTNPLALASRAGRVVLGGVRDDAVGSASPFVKAPIEALTGVNLFTGAKFSQQTPGPAYSVLSALPIIPDTYVNPETGQRETSGYALNQVRNLLPPIGQLDRLLPFGQQGSAAERLPGNWISQGLSFLPVTVSATLTESQYAGELRTRNLQLEQQIREYERRNGLPEGSLREQYNEGQKMLSQKSRRRALAAALAP